MTISRIMKVTKHKYSRSICDYFSSSTCFRDNSVKVSRKLREIRGKSFLRPESLVRLHASPIINFKLFSPHVLYFRDKTIKGFCSCLICTMINRVYKPMDDNQILDALPTHKLFSIQLRATTIWIANFIKYYVRFR